jgi:hypothetical protein
MSATELDDVAALLERVLPDPAGFAERLFQQLVGRWGDPGQSGAGNPDRAAGAPRFDLPEMVVAPRYRPNSYESLADSNVLLASALGACDCWGLQADCAVCGGEGSSGWTQPDLALFQEYVGPAVEKLSLDDAEAAANTEPAGQPEADGDIGSTEAYQDDRHRTTQGENT